MKDIELNAAEMLARYKTRRIACTLPDGRRPCAWWLRYRKDFRGTANVTDADIRRDAAKRAKELEGME